ncbi:zf-TFIIB domain-containing protein [Bradyrhizobium sp. SK17]|uniref:TFIIB-type zinc ribbon-containing protein n=1 Tax=Bradyrhizobium sp. SK17 TaxID=2057741 RepID=UPI001AED0099
MRTAETVAAMPCPICKTGLTLSDRQGVEIDFCPTCRGVWLDRGELDKVIERSIEDAAPARREPAPRAEATGRVDMTTTTAAIAMASGRSRFCRSCSTEGSSRLRRAGGVSPSATLSTPQYLNRRPRYCIPHHGRSPQLMHNHRRACS